MANPLGGDSCGIVARKTFTFAEPPDALTLKSGQRLGPVTLAYETCGALDADAANAVLICHALTGDAHVCGRHDPADERPGWWDDYVGPGKPIDTDRYFVICSNILGSCNGSTGPAGTNPATGRPWGLDFPLVTVTDMVEAQRRLVEHLGIRRLMAVVGGSLGGMQALEWAARHPQMVRGCVPLASTSKHSPQAIAFNEVARQSITSDPNWKDGAYHDGPRPDIGLAVARMIGHITYLSDESMHIKFGRNLQDREDFSFNFETDFQVESYLHHQGRKFVQRFDANSFLYVTKACDYFDMRILDPEGYAQQAFEGTGTKFLVVSFSSDWLYPTHESRLVVNVLKQKRADVSFCEVTAPWGHDAFLLPNETLATLLRGFLDRMWRERHDG